jgi:Cupin-like domain
MRNNIEVIDMPSPEEFVEEYVARNQPVVVNGLDFDPQAWTPEAMSEELGDLSALIYGSLFDLDDVQTLDDYLQDWFGLDGAEDDEPVPYVRWYNKLRDVEFAWGDEAFHRRAQAWRSPACIPHHEMLLPVSAAGVGVDPVIDRFPYRGMLIAAKGARTRLHRDPFFSDAVVCQFHGVKEAALYKPDRAEELQKSADGSSFGGFIDVRESADGDLTVEPDLHGFVQPGQMIYIPHGWVHDVIVAEDSVSVTWNFIHPRGAAEFGHYLADSPEQDSEFEILKFYHEMAGVPDESGAQMLARHFASTRL